MRVFVAFEGLYEPFDISAENTVKDVKLMVKVRSCPLANGFVFYILS